MPELAGAKVLIVDDDIRNIYSLTSVLEKYDVEVLHAERGKDGILILEQTPGIDVALIDIMMPEMDGYETMQQIRSKPELAELPLIAVTAKAMKGDRQKCLDAGASDYIAKPVDIDLLLALLRVWIAALARADGGGRAARRRGEAPRRWRRARRLNQRDQARARQRTRAARPGSSTRRRRSGRACWSSTTTSATCSPSAPCWKISARWSMARSGEEALRHLLKGEFAVILLDVYMPGMDGYETAQIIRSREQTKRIPIVFLSAVNKETEHLMRGYAMGAVDYVFKPVDPVVLRSKVAVFVDLFEMTHGDPAQGRRRSRHCSTPICAPMPSGCGSSRNCGSPSSARRRSSSRCRWCSIWRSSTPDPRAPKFVSGNFAALTGLYVRRGPGRRRPVGGAAPSRGSRAGRDGACRRGRKAARCAVEYRWQCADGSTGISSTRRCCCGMPRAIRSNLPARCSTSPTARSWKASWSKRARWMRSAS